MENKKCRICDNDKSTRHLCDKHYDEFVTFNENKPLPQSLQAYLDKEYPIIEEIDRADTLIHRGFIIKGYNLCLSEKESFKSKGVELKELTRLELIDRVIELSENYKKDIEGYEYAIKQTNEHAADLQKDIEELELSLEKYEKQNNTTDLRLFLLRHPDKEMVKAACLHFLGDKFQEMEKQTQPTDEIIQKYCIAFLDDIRDYERENGSQITHDERDSKELFEIFKENTPALFPIGQPHTEIDWSKFRDEFINYCLSHLPHDKKIAFLDPDKLFNWFKENLPRFIIQKPKEESIIDFATWYSGMDREKVVNAYNRYLKESPKEETK